MSIGEWAGLVGTAVSIIGLPLAWFFGRRNRQKPDLRYAVDYDEIVSPDDWLLSGGLALTFGSTSIQRVCRTFIAVWNDRGDTVQGADNLASDPIRIVLHADDSILQARVVAQSRHQIRMATELKENQVNEAMLTFEFLDAGDGAVLEILHHSPYPPHVQGTIKGANLRPIARVRLDAESRETLRLPKFKRYWTSRKKFEKIADFVFGFYTVMGVALTVFMLTVWNRTPTSISPAEFDLSTIGGQHDYAAKINQTNDLLPYSLSYWVLIGLIFVMVTARIVIYFLSRKSLPVSVVREELARPDPSFDSVSDVDLHEFKAGDTVRHRDFGEGTIVRFQNSSRGLIGTVDFPEAGVKRLLMSVAPLDFVPAQIPSQH